jgi:hypothetical protein
MSGSFSNSSRNQQERGPYSGTDFDVAPLASALGVDASQGPLVAALKQLCTTFFIRYGVGSLAPECANALGLPTSEAFKQRPSGVDRHKVFDDLCSRLTLPPKGTLLFDTSATIHLPSEDQMPEWQTKVNELSQQQSRLTQIPPELASKIPRDSIATVLQGIRDQSTTEAIAHLSRQLALFHECGAEWTRITTQEKALLEQAANVSRPASLPALPVEDRLAAFGLELRQSEKKGSEGPAFPGSKYPNSTLFDLSSKALKASLNYKDQSSDLPPAEKKLLLEFLEDLIKAAEDRQYGKRGWENKQQAAYRRLLHTEQRPLKRLHHSLKIP